MCTTRKKFNTIDNQIEDIECEISNMWDTIKELENSISAMKMDKATVSMSSPWVVLFRELETMFAEDEGIKVTFQDNSRIKLFVEDSEKAYALSKLIEAKHAFGNVEVYVEIVPANGYGDIDTDDTEKLFEMAFKGNPVLVTLSSVDLPMLNRNLYVVFKAKVVQYFNDDISDINGMRSTLYQELAKDIFVNPTQMRPCFCTEKVEV